MLNELVSLVMAVGIASGEGLAAGVAPAATAPTDPIVVVTATAPTPAAFMKFLREYSMINPPQNSCGNVEKSKVNGAERRGTDGEANCRRHRAFHAIPVTP